MAEKHEPTSPDTTRSGPLDPAASDAESPPSPDLASELRRREIELRHLRQVLERISRGVRLGEILDFLYEGFRDIIPYCRISFASYEPDSGLVVQRWVRSDRPDAVVLTEGFSAPLKKTSLKELVRTGRARIINDVEAYQRARPDSATARRLRAEGIAASLTFPLLIEKRPVGFLFFNSNRQGAYTDEHLRFLSQVAGVVAVSVERGRMVDQLADHTETIERQNRELAEVNHRHELELELARRVQASVMTRTLPECSSIDLAMIYEPAEAIGGDLLDSIRLDECRAMLLVADAMGHGVPAALLMGAVGAAFRTAVTQAQSDGDVRPAQLLADVNHTVCGLYEMNYVTAACVDVDVRRRSLRVSLAGHPPPLIARGGTRTVEQVEERGIPLGIEADYPYPEVEIPFAPGDTLMLYTDGVIEAGSAEHRWYGMDRLREFFASVADRPLEEVVAALRKDLDQHCDCHSLDDDVAALAMRMSPEATDGCNDHDQC